MEIIIAVVALLMGISFVINLFIVFPSLSIMLYQKLKKRKTNDTK